MLFGESKEDAQKRTGKSDAEGGSGIFGGLMDSLGGLATKLVIGGVGLAVILGGIGLALGALAAPAAAPLPSGPRWSRQSPKARAASASARAHVYFWPASGSEVTPR